MIALYCIFGIALIPVACFVFIFICSLFVNTKKEYTKDSAFFRFLLNFSTAVTIFMLQIKIHVSGMEKLPRDKKILFVCNHRSCYDPIISWYVLRQWKPAFVSKPSNFKIPIFGRIIRKCCFMPIDRTSPKNALHTVNLAAQLLKNQEVSVGVYPEGTRSKTLEMLPFHNGIFRIAAKANADIAVLSISGTEKIASNIPFKKSHIYLDVLEVVPADKGIKLKSDGIGKYAKELIMKSLEASGKREADQI